MLKACTELLTGLPHPPFRIQPMHRERFQITCPQLLIEYGFTCSLNLI